MPRKRKSYLLRGSSRARVVKIAITQESEEQTQARRLVLDAERHTAQRGIYKR